MGLGILDDRKLEHVPGTVALDDRDAVELQNGVGDGLKHAKGGDSHIILSPQPSEDPNDPLNWPLWKRDMILGIIAVGALLNAGTNAPLLNASFFQISLESDTPINLVARTSSWQFLATACIGPFLAAMAVKYGKRPVFLLSGLFNIIGTAVGESGETYHHLLVARIIQGLAIAAYESLNFSIVGDLYFVHQRGRRVSISNFTVTALSNLAAIICGQAFHNLGWLWVFHLYQIFLVIHFLLLFFLVPETTFNRDNFYNIDTVEDNILPELAQKVQEHAEHIAEIDAGEQAAEIPKKKTFFQELAVFTGTYTDVNILKLILEPFITIINPASLYIGLASGWVVACYAGTFAVMSLIFSGPPWHFNAAQVGYVGTGSLVGGICSSVFTAFTSDPLIKYMTRKNKGIYEPEFRLVFMAFTGIFCGVGMFCFGYVLEKGKPAPLCAFVTGLSAFGTLIAMVTTYAYGLDGFRARSNQIFVMGMIWKNMSLFGIIYFITDWVERSGPEPALFTFGGTCIFWALLAIPLYIYGKRIRSLWTRHDLVCHLEDSATRPAWIGLIGQSKTVSNQPKDSVRTLRQSQARKPEVAIKR